LTLDTAEDQGVPQFSEADDEFVCVNSFGSPLPQPSSKDRDGITVVTPNVDKVPNTDGGEGGVIVNSPQAHFLGKRSLHFILNWPQP